MEMLVVRVHPENSHNSRGMQHPYELEAFAYVWVVEGKEFLGWYIFTGASV